MARTYFSAATHAVVGTDAKGASGVLFWHDNEVDAHREAKSVQAGGGSCQVVPAPGGNLDIAMRAYVRTLAMPIV